MAYNTVNASLSLSRNAKTEAQTEEWPKNLRDFVSACFVRSKLLSAADKRTFDVEIKTLMKMAMDRKKIWENKWEEQDLPVLDGRGSISLVCERELEAARIRAEAARVEASVRAKAEAAKAKGANTTAKPQAAIQGIKRPADAAMFSRDKLQQRNARFEALTVPRLSAPVTSDPKHPLVGTCQDLEKKYLRLTSAPDPSRVRPLPVLQKTLELLLQKHSEGATYAYLCDQFKSLRQDLTVQHIKNEFTVLVYEAHARFAIEHADLGEFNQCQSQLKTLYALPGMVAANQPEFIGYRVIYHLMTLGYTDVYKVRASLGADEAQQPEVANAFALARAQQANNYHEFFRLYNGTQRWGRKLIEVFIERERLKALGIMCGAYRVLPVAFVAGELGFETPEAFGEWIAEVGLQGFVEGSAFRCAQARLVVEGLRKGKLR